MNNTKFVIWTGHKAMEYLLEVPMKQRNILLLTPGNSGHHCQIEHVTGTQNTSCEDLQLRAPSSEHLQHDDIKDVEIHDNTLKVYFNSIVINPKNYTKYDVRETNTSFKLQIKQVEGDEGTSLKNKAITTDIAQTLRSVELCLTMKTLRDNILSLMMCSII